MSPYLHFLVSDLKLAQTLQVNILRNELGIIDIPLVFRFSPAPRRDPALLLGVPRSQPQPRSQLRLPPAPPPA